jgi:methionine-rich copper-binding protein CopC
MKPALALLLLALAVALAFPASPAYAQIELTEADPPDGTLLDAPPDVVHLCFSQPVNNEDKASFDFSYQMPDGHRLGLRIAFQTDGECVDVYPGLPDERPAGEYTFEWQVTAAEGDEEGSGTLQFQVSESSTATPAPSPTPGETPPPVTPSPEAGTVTGDAGDDDGPDILLLALITTASVGGIAVLFTLGYFLRRRIGYEPHRPPEGDEGGGDH